MNSQPKENVAWSQDIKKEINKNYNSALDFFNEVYYLYRRNGWMLDPTRFFSDFDSVEIDRPFFLLGPSGGGLTLISRMLRRNKEVVSVSGNYKYWAGADEMQLVLGPILPSELAGIKHKASKHPDFPTPRGWLFGTEELIDEYRNNKNDATKELAARFKKILRWQIARNRIGKGKVRFTEKSQVFTVKVSFINELLKEHNPHFILIMRDPYTMCWRGAQTKGGMSHIRDEFSFEERLELACQHWSNLMYYALKDGEQIDNFTTVKFEDILKQPEKELKELCNFLDLSFEDRMVPSADDEIPFGSKYPNKWYPLREEVNEKYLNKITSEQADLIEKHCGKYADKFGYEKP